jgi:uncharacterized membrane protein YkvA (DUF1232 family)
MGQAHSLQCHGGPTPLTKQRISASLGTKALGVDDVLAEKVRTMWQKGRELANSFKRELTVYRRVLADARTPASAKIFLGLAIAYLCMPFDLIPDFIPVLGHLDDVVIVPALVYAALRLIPQDLVAEHRANAFAEHARNHTYNAAP